MGLPPGAEYPWKVSAWNPLDSIDDSLLQGFLDEIDPAAAQRYNATTTYWWTFTVD